MTVLAREIATLLGKEVRLELRQKYVINGILLYLLSTLFVTYLAFDRIIDAATWNSLFWIILLFVAVNGISKSFVQENPSRYYYYYTVASPQSIILSKIIYNLLLMSVLALLAAGMFLLLLGNYIADFGLFLVALMLGSWGLASILTIVSAIASRAGNHFSLMAILSFPIVLPLLATLIRISAASMAPDPRGDVTGDLIILVTLDFAVIALGYLLFPYLWKD